jgi:hypothetical protein
MEGFMIQFLIMFYFCIFMIVLAVIIGVFIFLEKRVSDSVEAGEARKILTFIAGTGTDLLGLLIVFAIAGMAEAQNSYFIQDRSMTDEMIQRKLIELEFNILIIYGSAFVAGILVLILGGYLAGRVARRNEVASGLGTSIAVSLAASSILFVVLTIIQRSPAFQLTSIVFVTMMIVGSTALGGYFAMVRRRRIQEKITAKTMATLD